MLYTGAAAPSWLAMLPKNADEPKGAYVWFNKEIVDWVNGPVPGTKHYFILYLMLY